MPQSGDKDSLAERLRKKAEAERLEVEKIVANEYATLANSLKRMSSDVLSSTEASFRSLRSSMEKGLAQIEHRQKRLWLWSVAGPVLVSVLILIGLWAVTGWKRMELNDLQRQVMSEQQTLTQLQAKTGGVRLLRGQEEQVQWYLVLPDRTQAQQFSCDDKPCIKLGRE